MSRGMQGSGGLPGLTNLQAELIEKVIKNLDAWSCLSFRCTSRTNLKLVDRFSENELKRLDHVEIYSVSVYKVKDIDFYDWRMNDRGEISASEELFYVRVFGLTRLEFLNPVWRRATVEIGITESRYPEISAKIENCGYEFEARACIFERRICLIKRTWMLEDEFHREDGPAYEKFWVNRNRFAGNIEQRKWMFRGQYHRVNGPAHQEFFEDGAFRLQKWFRIIDGVSKLYRNNKEGPCEEIYSSPLHAGMRVFGDE